MSRRMPLDEAGLRSPSGFLSYLGDAEGLGDAVRAGLAADGLGEGDVVGCKAACCCFIQLSKSAWSIAWTTICIWLWLTPHSSAHSPRQVPVWSIFSQEKLS